VHIYKYPSKELVHKFKADTTIRCTDIVFSRDGRYLLMIGGIPDFKISIFDLENNKKVNLSRDEKGDTSNKLPCKPAEYRKAKFNPQNSKEFCILASNVIYFYKIHQAYEVADQGDGQAREPSEGERLSFVEYRNENPELTFTTFIWDQCKRIHVCTDLPLVLMIDSQYAKEENTLSVTGRPLALLMT
jgi:WD40 repeat protein